MTLQVGSEQVRLQAFHLDWTRSHKGQKLNWTKEKDRPNFKFNFNPQYVANKDNSECAEARRFLKQDFYRTDSSGRSIYTHTSYFSKIIQKICLIGDSLAVKWTKELNSYEIVDDYIILTAFLVAQGESSFKISLHDDGNIHFWKETKRSISAKYESQLSNFIRCGPNFVDNTHNLEVVETTAYYKTTSTSTSQSSADKQTHHYGWIIATVFCLGIVVTLVCIILIKKMRKKKKNRDKKRIRNDKHSSLGSSVSTAIGSSNVLNSNVSSVGSSASSCSNASSGASSTASTGTSSGMTSSSSAHGSSAKATKSKHRSLMDTVSSIFKKNQKKNAKQRSKVDKAKECKKKKDGSKKGSKK